MTATVTLRAPAQIPDVAGATHLPVDFERAAVRILAAIELGPRAHRAEAVDDEGEVTCLAQELEAALSDHEAMVGPLHGLGERVASREQSADGQVSSVGEPPDVVERVGGKHHPRQPLSDHRDG